MSIDPGPIARHLQQARWRRILVTSLCVLPIAAALVLVAHRVYGPMVAIALAVTIKVIAGLALARALRVIDPRWVVRRLDAALPELDDSTELLLSGEEALAPLARLQRQRVIDRLMQRAQVDVREPWPRGAVIACFVVALVIAGLGWFWRPTAVETLAATSTETSTPSAPSNTRVLDVRASIAPPAYTGLPERAVDAFDFPVESGARVTWRVRLDTTPSAVALEFHDRSRVELRRDGDAWIGDREIAQSTLYRLRVEDAPPLIDDNLHRIDAIADRAPEVRVIEPDRTLTLLEPPQTRWSLAFEAQDDYGLGAASLRITLAQGGGENVTFKEQTLALKGEGDARSRRYRQVLDLPQLGVAEGDDVIVRLSVADNRSPQANVTRSASFILRWPPPLGDESTGMEGLVQRRMPAYFRSQRQIIIDTEALIAEQPRLSRDDFMARANAIGEDQRVLRLRYGQFLGEESEDPAAEAPQGGDDHDDHEAEGHHHGGPGVGEAQARATRQFGDGGNVLADFGHVHDIAEAATLLDPETKETLRAALNAMWSAELALRQGTLKAALPHENRALAYIKQVQQSTRIYLARVGLELPAIDNARRLTGERKDLRDRASALVARQTDATIVTAWQALEGDGEIDIDALDRWVRERERDLPDALGLLAELDRLRGDADCGDCRAHLRNLLWNLLPTPPTATRTRKKPGDEGRAYLEALGQGGAR